MIRNLVIAGLLLTGSAVADMAPQNFGKLMLDQLEWRDADEGQPMVWEIDAWYGGDINKLWLKSEGERLDGHTESGELQLLWDRALTPFWDLQLGGRLDFQPDDPRREWLAVGVQGLAPYFLETEATLFVGDAGRAALRLRGEYELLLTQRLILSPELEVTLYSEDDVKTGTGSGVNDVEAGLRLRYEIRRRFAPYIGINWEKRYGSGADFARAEGEDIEDGQFVLGLRAWF